MDTDLNNLSDLVNSQQNTDLLATQDILEDALRKLGQVKPNINDYPDYFDTLLNQIIDLVPLE